MHRKTDNQNGQVPSPASFEPNDRLKRVVQFYSMKLHLIMIPVGIVMAIVHLKFAIQYFGQCSMQPMINIYMIVHAAVHLSVNFLNIIGVIDVRCIYPRVQDERKRLPRIILIAVVISTLIISLFSFAWMIAGSVWVFGAKVNGVQGSDPTATSTYCPSDLVKAAFTLLIINYVIHVLIIVGVIAKRICGKKHTSNNPDAPMDSMKDKL